MSTAAPDERRDRTRKEIKQLIEERNTVLAQYYNLAKQSDNFDQEELKNESNNTLELLEEFCQELVDYMATGHFEIYRRIEEGNERRDEVTKLADMIMPRLNDTTQIAVAFNDLYDDTSNVDNKDITLLPNHLEKLGKELATRIDLEDQLINTLLTVSNKPALTAVNV